MKVMEIRVPDGVRVNDAVNEVIHQGGRILETVSDGTMTTLNAEVPDDFDEDQLNEELDCN